MTEKELDLLVEISVSVDQIKQRLDAIEQHLFKTPRLRHDLLGRQVISVGGSATRCVGCPWDCGNCVKVELVGGTYLCLDKPHEEDAKPVISFDEEDDNKGLLDIMAEIKEKADNFMDYIDSVTKKEQ